MTQPDNFFWCPECGTVEARSPDRGYPPPCSNAVCRAAKPRPHWQPFDRDAWDECQTHRVHASMLRQFNVVPSERRLRLHRCAFARFAFPSRIEFETFTQAIHCGEAWAETGTPPVATDNVRRQLHDFISTGLMPLAEIYWSFAALGCLDAQVELHPGKYDRTYWPALADSSRELFANPFLPLAWNPDWFTPTARDLAAHIYASRDFGVMPILADALQDAGCDDEQVLTHCRADKPHARGGWVLDAVLGKR